MNLNENTRFLIGALAVATASVVGYGIYQALNPKDVVVPRIAPAKGETSVTVQTAGAPGKPSMTIQGENIVVANTPGHVTAVTGDPDLTFEWTIQGGTIEGEADGASVTWTAGNGPQMYVTCKGTSPTGSESVLSMQVIVRQPPAITRFEATPAVITTGSTAALTWTAAYAQKLTLEPGGQDLSTYSGPTLDVRPSETTTYTLTATNRTGVTATRDITVKVVPPAEITALKSEPVAGATGTFRVSAEFKGGKAELKEGDKVIGASETSPLTIEAKGLKEGSVLVLTVANEAGTYVSSSLKFSATAK